MSMSVGPTGVVETQYADTESTRIQNRLDAGAITFPHAVTVSTRSTEMMIGK